MNDDIEPVATCETGLGTTDQDVLADIYEADNAEPELWT
jgi:hypothetical protein